MRFFFIKLHFYIPSPSKKPPCRLQLFQPHFFELSLFAQTLFFGVLVYKKRKPLACRKTGILQVLRSQGAQEYGLDFALLLGKRVMRK